jgi:hypothetical protein
LRRYSEELNLAEAAGNGEVSWSMQPPRSAHGADGGEPLSKRMRGDEAGGARALLPPVRRCRLTL